MPGRSSGRFFDNSRDWSDLPVDPPLDLPALQTNAATQVKLGNLVRLAYEPLQPLPRLGLLRVDMLALGIDPLKLNSWVLTVAGGPVSDPTFGAQDAHLVVADVTFGSGATQSDFEANAFPGFTAQIASTTVDVDARMVVRPFPDVAQVIEVRAFLKIGFATTDAHRWFSNLEMRANGADPATVRPIPRYAKDMMVYSSIGALSAFYALALPNGLRLQGGGDIVVEYSGAQVLGILNAGGRIPIPGGCTHWSLPGAAAILNVNVDFGLDL